MAEFDEEERAERAKEFRFNINEETPKSSRKRYSVASPYAHAQGKKEVYVLPAGNAPCLVGG